MSSSKPLALAYCFKHVFAFLSSAKLPISQALQAIRCVFVQKSLAAWLKNVWFAGLWTTGDGEIECPLSEDMFFLPQQPFMPLGTLRQQLLFPSGQPYSAPALHSNQTSTVFMTFEIRYVIQDCNLQLSHCECCHLRLSEYKNHKYNASSAVWHVRRFLQSAQRQQCTC